MRVEMKTRYAGPSGVAKPGQVIDVPAKEGKELVKGRYAIPSKEKAEQSTAAPNSEKAQNGPKSD